jgi:hypothetical protein
MSHTSITITRRMPEGKGLEAGFRMLDGFVKRERGSAFVKALWRTGV